MAYGTKEDRAKINTVIKKLGNKKDRSHAETIQLFDALYVKAFALYQEVDLNKVKYTDTAWQTCRRLRNIAQLAVNILYAMPQDHPDKLVRIRGLHGDKCAEIAMACEAAIRKTLFPPGSIYDRTPSALEKFTLTTSPMPHPPREPYPGAFAEYTWRAKVSRSEVAP